MKKEDEHLVNSLTKVIPHKLTCEFLEKKRKLTCELTDEPERKSDTIWNLLALLSIETWSFEPDERRTPSIFELARQKRYLASGTFWKVASWYLSSQPLFGLSFHWHHYLTSVVGVYIL